MKRSIVSLLIVLMSAIVLQTGCKTISTEKLKNSIEILDIETSWVSKYYQPWPPRLILVPRVSFKIKNIGKDPLKYVNFNAIFAVKGEAGNLGDGYLAAIRNTPVLPGATSPVITLTSNFGVEGKNVKQIEDNPAWRPVEVRIFAQSRGSQFGLLGVFDVSRKIDFKEENAADTKKAGAPKSN